jgi:hypothetical protein
MSRLTWNAVGSRFFETGVDRGVLFVDTNPGIPWSGLTGVSESSSGGTAKPFYLDGVKYLNVPSAEEFEATITAFTYPVEFSVCDGSGRPRPGLFLGQQRRKTFGFSYRTRVGNDLEGADYGYKLHLVYNALAEPSERGFTSTGKDTDVSDFSWKLTTKAIIVPGYKPTAHMVLDSRYINPITLGKIEDMLYGGDSTISHLPTFDELIAQLDEPLDFVLTDNGDGTFTLGGPPEILVVDNTTGLFTLTWPTADYNGDGTYTISD